MIEQGTLQEETPLWKKFYGTSNRLTCMRKVRFENAETAYSVRDKKYKRLNVYFCDQCEGWHLGHKCSMNKQIKEPKFSPSSPFYQLAKDTSSKGASLRQLEHIEKLNQIIRNKNREIKNLKRRLHRLRMVTAKIRCKTCRYPKQAMKIAIRSYVKKCLIRFKGRILNFLVGR